MIRRHLIPLLALAALVVLPGCERGYEKEEPFPQAAADGWLAAFNSGDAAGLALMYSPMSRIYPPDAPAVTGHDAIEEFWKTAYPGTVRVEVSEVETMKVGDYWFREGAYKAIDDAEGEPVFGKFMEIWKKIDSA